MMIARINGQLNRGNLIDAAKRDWVARNHRHCRIVYNEPRMIRSVEDGGQILSCDERPRRAPRRPESD
jgi:hypothetical protein